MRNGQLLARFAVIPLALLLLGAAPGERVIPHPHVDGEVLIIPPDSPVSFRGFDENGVAHFTGQFVLTGRFFVEGCQDTCPGAVEEDLEVSVFPDPELEARLPHWRVHNNDIAMGLMPRDRLMDVVSGPEQRAALLTGKARDIRGRIAIIVEEFQTSIECDSANFSAHFIAVAEAPKIANVDFNGDYGCF